MKRSVSGFTIVELLIVIVVIAILAAISVVAYNGIQSRAKFTQQASHMEQLVRAIRLYKAEGGAMNDGVAGAGGAGYWYGGPGTVYPGSSKTIRQALIDSGHLSADFTTHFMLAICTDINDQRRVVLGKFDPIPDETPQEQIAPENCTHGTFATYTDPNQQYKMNYAKIVH